VDHFNGDNNDDMHRNGELRFIREIIPRCATVFDVGANIGDWTDLVLSIKPQLKVHCFEPCTSTFQRLQKRNFGAGVVLNHAGLGAHIGDAKMYIFEECAGTNSLYHRQGLKSEQGTTETIRVDTLDDYCERQDIGQIDLLKIDVEGHELSVLQGSTRMLSQSRIKRVQFEYGGTFIDARILLKDMFELLTVYNFTFYKIYPEKVKLIERYDQRLENFQYQNWVALW
jgi:FkbM family methyltransferase